MPLTVLNTTGDGVSATWIDAQIQLPDSGTSVKVTGNVCLPGGTPVNVTGSPVTIPAAPGSGSIFYNIQVDGTTGAATVQQSTSADPAPINGNSVVIFRQTLVPSSTDPATTGETTPDSW